ncbi:ShlB/FhaC/HecB family hemolysin secretion/activation protein [Acidithiobacillus thiooxidans]|uniref:Haemolysin activator HlyB C-terminal domain-containing protein n=1 Tax=Acidithiobacillus thiooxidans TaxID=930 RepID=A0A1C2IE22_ACITH|nr:ShlB/FhaC/HecB family hemolysin secretion/activation protein [Acidithiobacillus thiooxidans]OCX74197.1 hypothetical protein A6M23_06400 [Acidithiobacillus thiooxidans]
MQADTPPFLPSSHPPAIHQLAAPSHGARQLVIQSHGYSYLVTGNTLLASSRIRTILLHASTPQEAVGALSMAYRKSGYFLVAVKASVENKNIHIMVVQGQISKKDIASGLGWFYSGLQGEDLTESTIIRRNILAESYSARNGQQLGVNFTPSQNPDGTDLNVQQTPRPNYQMLGGNLLFGNYGSRYISSYLVGGSVYLHPGAGLQIDGNYTRGLSGLSKDSAGSTYYQGSIGINSITPWGTYGFSSQWTHYLLGQTAPYYFTGNIVSYALNGSQLLFANTNSRLISNEAFTIVGNKVTALQKLYTLTQQDYDYYTLGITYNHVFRPFSTVGNLTASINYNQGVSGFHGTLVKVPGTPTPKFHYLTFNLNYSENNLPLGFSAQFTSSGQWAFNTLPQNQQWVVGGFGSVSAYNSGTLVGDSGYSARLSLQSPALHRYGVSASGSLFFETAGVTSHYLSPGQAPWQNLSDVGIGLNVSTRWGTTLSVMSALPVAHSVYPASSAENLHKNRVDAFFILQQSF